MQWRTQDSCRKGFSENIQTFLNISWYFSNAIIINQLKQFSDRIEMFYLFCKNIYTFSEWLKKFKVPFLHATDH